MSAKTIEDPKLLEKIREAVRYYADEQYWRGPNVSICQTCYQRSPEPHTKECAIGALEAWASALDAWPSALDDPAGAEETEGER